MFRHNLVKFSHGCVPCGRILLTELIDRIGIKLGLLLHLLSQTRDILLFSLQLLVFLLNHLLQCLHSLVGCI